MRLSPVSAACAHLQKDLPRWLTSPKLIVPSRSIEISPDGFNLYDTKKEREHQTGGFESHLHCRARPDTWLRLGLLGPKLATLGSPDQCHGVIRKVVITVWATPDKRTLGILTQIEPFPTLVSRAVLSLTRYRWEWRSC